MPLREIRIGTLCRRNLQLTKDFGWFTRFSKIPNGSWVNQERPKFRHPDSQLHYHRLAAIMSQDKDLAIFRRFDQINITCLLALQSEILDFEYEFKSQCRDDDQSSLAEENQFSRSFFKLRSSKPRSSERETREGNQSNAIDKGQLGLRLELESKFSKYSEL
jgi:hypothetical protein